MAHEELTPTQIKSVAHLAAENLIDDLLFIVDMNAPTALLMERFREAIEKVKSSKEQKDIYNDWSNYGVLPFIDLSGWNARNPALKPDQETRFKLVLPQLSSFGPKQYAKTKILADAVMDTKGEVFTALKATAAREISTAIDLARAQSSAEVPSAVGEAWERWFPHTYPVDIYSMRRLGRAFPTPGASAAQVEEIFRKDGLFSLPTPERIRKFKPDPAVHTDALLKLGATLGF
ncbi:MAG: hypothetical protein ACLQMO_11405 [Acidobacteriaceae bacterium]